MRGDRSVDLVRIEALVASQPSHDGEWIDGLELIEEELIGAEARRSRYTMPSNRKYQGLRTPPRTDRRLRPRRGRACGGCSPRLVAKRRC
jgi:hypothetical protein